MSPMKNFLGDQAQSLTFANFSFSIRRCLQWVRGLWSVRVKLLIYVDFVY